MSEKMQITLDKEDLQAVFDLALEGEGMMSGWWGQEEVDSARKIAVLLGVNPMVATPREFANHTRHDYEPTATGVGGIYTKCKWCKVNSQDFPHVDAEESE
jgi:hypothetical protein